MTSRCTLKESIVKVSSTRMVDVGAGLWTNSGEECGL